jgi:hypothetical protein
VIPKIFITSDDRQQWILSWLKGRKRATIAEVFGHAPVEWYSRPSRNAERSLARFDLKKLHILIMPD